MIEGGGAEIFYTHWRADALTTDLFWGPTYAVTFARAQRPSEPRELLDEVWAEGGALIDLDRNTLLLFGGGDLRCHIPLRRLYLRLLAHPWKGWEVRWAFEGVCDLADYVGIPRAQVLAEREPTPQLRLSASGPFVRAWSLASVKGARAEMLLIPAPHDAEEYLRIGPEILDIDECDSVGVYKHDALGGFPHPIGGGFHIDEAQRSLEFWTASDAPHLMNRVSAAWPDWRVTWYQDRFEFQIARTGGRFNVEIPSAEELIREIRAELLIEEKVGNVESFLQVTESLVKQGEQVTKVNPLALRDARLTLSLAERTKIVDEAIAALRAGDPPAV